MRESQHFSGARSPDKREKIAEGGIRMQEVSTRTQVLYANSFQ